MELVRFSMLSRGGVKLRSRASELACTGVKRVECVRLRLELARFDFLDATHAACFWCVLRSTCAGVVPSLLSTLQSTVKVSHRNIRCNAR